MKKVFSEEINIRTISELNCSQHWTMKSKRHKQQKYSIWKVYKFKDPIVTLPCMIILTRYSIQMMDFDNLAGSFKWILDQVCECITPGLAIGRADGNPKIKVEYKQEKRKKHGILIEIYC
jgi:hypothetical protein